MRQRVFDQPLPQTATSVFFKNVNIAEIGEGRPVGDQTGKAHLGTPVTGI